MSDAGLFFREPRSARPTIAHGLRLGGSHVGSADARQRLRLVA
jgi:hypothetical protein